MIMVSIEDGPIVVGSVARCRLLTVAGARTLAERLHSHRALDAAEEHLLEVLRTGEGGRRFPVARVVPERGEPAAASFFDHEFDTGTLAPGQSAMHTFGAAGEYFYNDPAFPQSTGRIVVQ